MPNWKDLFTNRDRRLFPEVVVPLSHEPVNSKANTSGESDIESKDLQLGLGPKSSHDRDQLQDSLQLQEKGIANVPTTSKLTFEALRAEVETAVVVSGHDNLYDRMFCLVFECFFWTRNSVLRIYELPILVEFIIG